MSIDKVIYEDNHLIAVDKPAGILSQGDKSGDVSMFEEVKKYLKEKYKKPGKVFVGLLHRLDRPVSGIMLFAKTSKGASRLSKQFRNRTIGKVYYAIILGKLKNNKGMLTNNLIKNQKLKKSQADPVYQFARLTRRASHSPAGRRLISKSHLYYEVVKNNEKYSLLKIKIDTGKFHQIRAQLAAAGFPILGDVKYGGPKWDNPKAIALRAVELSFTTATNEKRIHLKVELQEEWCEYLRSGTTKTPLSNQSKKE